MNIQDIAAAAAKSMAGKAADVIDSNRSQIVADFDQAMTRQRTEFMREISILTTRVTRSVLTAGAMVCGGLLVHTVGYFLHS